VLTPFGHRSDKKRIYAAKEFKQNLKHCKQLRKLYLQTEKVKKTNIPLKWGHGHKFIMLLVSFRGHSKVPPCRIWLDLHHKTMSKMTW
jgi:hypothetical protein